MVNWVSRKTKCSNCGEEYVFRTGATPILCPVCGLPTGPNLFNAVEEIDRLTTQVNGLLDEVSGLLDDNKRLIHEKLAALGEAKEAQAALDYQRDVLQNEIDIQNDVSEILGYKKGESIVAGVKELQAALKLALQEIKEHNNEYHHLTSDKIIKQLASLLI